MPYFRYKSVDSKGKKVSGGFEAVDKAAAAYMIKQRGLIPVEINIDNDFTHSLRKLGHSRMPVKDIAIFCRQFATILTAGVTVLSAMDMLRRQTANKRLAKAINLAFEDLQKGHTLSRSFKAREDVFPELLVNMVESGEISGTLDSTMQRMAAHYEKESWIYHKIRAAMTYPMILAGISVLMVIFMVYFILPNFMSLIDTSNVEMPKLTLIVIDLTEFVRTKWYLILIFVAALIGSFKYVTGFGTGRKIYHKVLLHAPVLGRVLKKIIASRFTRTLGILLSTGIPLLTSLESAKRTIGNAVAEEAIENSIAAVKNGQGLSMPLKASGIFDAMVISMIQIGEETGSLDEMLSKTADFFDSEVEAGLTKLMLIMEPVMLIIMGTVVGTIVAAMLLPMYGMLSNLGV
ncbi:MAG: type II secretion system F family protein [Caulobacteraceae bacterium]